MEYTWPEIRAVWPFDPKSVIKKKEKNLPHTCSIKFYFLMARLHTSPKIVLKEKQLRIWTSVLVACYMNFSIAFKNAINLDIIADRGGACRINRSWAFGASRPFDLLVNIQVIFKLLWAVNLVYRISFLLGSYIVFSTTQSLFYVLLFLYRLDICLAFITFWVHDLIKEVPKLYMDAISILFNPI